MNEKDKINAWCDGSDCAYCQGKVIEEEYYCLVCGAKLAEDAAGNLTCLSCIDEFYKLMKFRGPPTRRELENYFKGGMSEK